MQSKIDQKPSDGGIAPRHPLGMATKRLMDLVIAFAMLVVCLPIFVITAILIKLDSAGPVFFRQERVGLNGKLVSNIQVSHDGRRRREHGNRAG